MLETWQYFFPQQTRNAFRMTFLPKLEKRPGVVICPKLLKKQTSAFNEGRRPEFTRLLSGFNHNQFFLRSNPTAFPIAKRQLISSHKSKRIEKVRSWKETLADFSRFFRPVLSNNEAQGAAKKKNTHTLSALGEVLHTFWLNLAMRCGRILLRWDSYPSWKNPGCKHQNWMRCKWVSVKKKRNFGGCRSWWKTLAIFELPHLWFLQKPRSPWN